MSGEINIQYNTIQYKRWIRPTGPRPPFTSVDGNNYFKCHTTSRHVRAGVNSTPELDFVANSNFGI